MHTKNHKNCSKIECLMSQKALAPNILSKTVVGLSCWMHVYSTTRGDLAAIYD